MGRWQELAENSAIRRFLGLTALPHLGVEWYAKGGIVDGATLRKAQENPDEYHNLVVRIAGFSAYFVQLSEGIQDDVIYRSEFEI